MKQDDDFYAMLPSNANSYQFRIVLSCCITSTNSFARCCRRIALMYEQCPESLVLQHCNGMDDEWNITLTAQDVWIMVTTSVAQALGSITSENKIRRMNEWFKNKFYDDTSLLIQMVCVTSPYVYYVSGYLSHTFDGVSLPLQTRSSTSAN